MPDYPLASASTPSSRWCSGTSPEIEVRDVVQTARCSKRTQGRCPAPDAGTPRRPRDPRGGMDDPTAGRNGYHYRVRTGPNRWADGFRTRKQPMKCASACRGESARPASRSLSTAGRGHAVVRKRTRRICDTCGERYFDEATTAQLLRLRRNPAQAASRSRCARTPMTLDFSSASSAASPTSATPAARSFAQAGRDQDEWSSPTPPST